MTDLETLAVYAASAEDYAALVTKDGPSKSLRDFIARLPQGGRVLDWGCGAGNAAAGMRDAGLVVTATDATPEFAALVERSYGIAVRVEPFEALTAEAEYDGVWASFSLLHAPRADLAQHLGRARRALKPGGWLYLGMKLGQGEARDKIGRFYSYFSAEELHAALEHAGFAVAEARRGEEVGLDGQMWPFILLYAQATERG